MLADCEVEMHRYATEDRQQDLDDWEVHMRWETAEESAKPVSALWRNTFKVCRIQVPVNSGETSVRVITALLAYQAAQE